MKKYFLLLLFIIISCQQNNGKATYIVGTNLNVNGFTITTDTITINENGIIQPILRYNNKYYYSSYLKESLGNYKLTHFGSIDSKGNIQKLAGTNGSDGIGGYNDMHIRHDSVVIKLYYDETTSFYLDEKNKKCVSINTVDDAIYEDDDYYVTSLDFGEWGCATWFKDKKTGIEYEATGFLPPEIKKFKGAYYLISPREINVVDNPKLLENVGTRAYRSFIGMDKSGKFYSRRRYEKGKGIRNIYSREKTSEYEADFFMGPAIIHNNSIMYVVSNQNKVSVANVKDKKLIPVAIIDDNISINRHPNQYRNLYLNQTIMFSKHSLPGLLEIKDSHIFLHYFKNSLHKKSKPQPSTEVGSLLSNFQLIRIWP